MSYPDLFIRLFHVLVHDDILPILTKSMESDEFGDKETFGRQLELWSKVAAVQNDPSFLPNSLYLPTLHNDFKTVRPLPAPEEKQKMQDLFNYFMKTKNQLFALREFVYSDGKHKDSKPSIVSLMKRADTNERFGALHAFPPSVLYLWHMEDSYQWLPFKKMEDSEQSAMLEQSGLKGDKSVSGPPDAEFLIKSLRIGNAEESLASLEGAELHHSEMAKSFADMVSKISSVGGKQQDTLVKVVDNIVDRVDSSYKRCTAIESAILVRQRNV